MMDEPQIAVESDPDVESLSEPFPILEQDVRTNSTRPRGRPRTGRGIRRNNHWSHPRRLKNHGQVRSSTEHSSGPVTDGNSMSMDVEVVVSQQPGAEWARDRHGPVSGDPLQPGTFIDLLPFTASAISNHSSVAGDNNTKGIGSPGQDGAAPRGLAVVESPHHLLDIVDQTAGSCHQYTLQQFNLSQLITILEALRDSDIIVVFENGPAGTYVNVCDAPVESSRVPSSAPSRTGATERALPAHVRNEAVPDSHRTGVATLVAAGTGAVRREVEPMELETGPMMSGLEDSVPSSQQHENDVEQRWEDIYQSGLFAELDGAELDAGEDVESFLLAPVEPVDQAADSLAGLNVFEPYIPRLPYLSDK